MFRRERRDLEILRRKKDRFGNTMRKERTERRYLEMVMRRDERFGNGYEERRR